MGEAWTPAKAANRLVRLAEAFSAAHGVARFPVEVERLALGAADIFKWSDPITEIQAANIPGFEGALFPDGKKSSWLLLYNDGLKSPGRVRFTQAHELGHYVLHRQLKDSFECTDSDMFEWSLDDKNIESEADVFASYLLMPLNDFRAQITSTIDLDLLGACADRYGVSLTAAVLKWLQHTEEKAVLVISNDGFIDWASSSKPAMTAGAFFKTRGNVIPVPDGSFAANPNAETDRQGKELPAKIWFPHADPLAFVREMKIASTKSSAILSLLVLPRSADVWPSWTNDFS